MSNDAGKADVLRPIQATAFRVNDPSGTVHIVPTMVEAQRLVRSIDGDASITMMQSIPLELEQLRAYAVSALRLLQAAKCPNSNCANGAIPHYDGKGNLEWEQCQWCYERAELAKNPVQRQGADSPASASISPSTECLSPAKADAPRLPSDVSLPGAQSAPATPELRHQSGKKDSGTYKGHRFDCGLLIEGGGMECTCHQVGNNVPRASFEEIERGLRKKTIVRGREWDFDEWLRAPKYQGDHDADAPDPLLVECADHIRDLRTALASQIDISNGLRIQLESRHVACTQPRTESSEGHGALLPSRNPLREGCPMHSCRDAGACCFPSNCDTSRPAINRDAGSRNG